MGRKGRSLEWGRDWGTSFLIAEHGGGGGGACVVTGGIDRATSFRERKMEVGSRVRKDHGGVWVLRAGLLVGAFSSHGFGADRVRHSVSPPKSHLKL